MKRHHVTRDQKDHVFEYQVQDTTLKGVCPVIHRCSTKAEADEMLGMMLKPAEKPKTKRKTPAKKKVGTTKKT